MSESDSGFITVVFDDYDVKTLKRIFDATIANDAEAAAMALAEYKVRTIENYEDMLFSEACRIEQFCKGRMH